VPLARDQHDILGCAKMDGPLDGSGAIAFDDEPLRRDATLHDVCDDGVGLLLTIPKDGSVWSIVLITLKTAAGLAALAAAAQNWALRRNTILERVAWTLAGLLLVFPSLIEAGAEKISGYDVPHPAPLGLAIAAAVLLKQYYDTRRVVPANR